MVRDGIEAKETENAEETEPVDPDPAVLALDLVITVVATARGEIPARPRRRAGDTEMCAMMNVGNAENIKRVPAPDDMKVTRGLQQLLLENGNGTGTANTGGRKEHMHMHPRRPCRPRRNISCSVSRGSSRGRRGR